MNVYECLSIIATCLSVIAAVAAFVVPIVISSLKSKKEEKERNFNRLYAERIGLYDNFANAYNDWKQTKNNEEFISVIYDLMARVDHWACNHLSNLITALNNEANNVDKIYNDCIRSLLRFLGIDYYGESPRELIYKATLKDCHLNKD